MPVSGLPYKRRFDGLSRFSKEQRELFLDVQGNILKGFNKPNVRLIFFKFGDIDATKKWLSGIAAAGRIMNTLTLIEASEKLKVEREKDPGYKPQETCLHVSLSYRVLKEKLGFKIPPSKEIYKGVGKETKITQPVPARTQIDSTKSDDPFYEGMKSRHDTLGDTFESHPDNWIEPYKSSDIDALFILASDMEEDLDFYTSRLIAETTPKGIICVGMEIGKAIENEQGKQVEHFGFRDGISQPLIVGIDDEDINERKINKDLFYPEDFLVHGIDHKELRWANNGSFLAFRRLHQDVAGFWEYTGVNCNNPDFEMNSYSEELAAKIVGRWKSGAPLAEYPSSDPVLPQFDHNDFLYRNTTFNDPDGAKTPKFAHIRVANLRDHHEGERLPNDNSKVNAQHRILRRGIPYGLPWARDKRREVDRGLLFICYQRDLANQFEQIQRRWLNYNHTYANVTGPHARILAMLRSKGYSKVGFERWVTTTGGAYFFSPSISSLKYIQNPPDNWNTI